MEVGEEIQSTAMNEQSMNDLTSPVRLLVRGVNWLGDAIMTTPALVRLREAHPDWQITLLTRSSLADLWSHHPAIDRVMMFEPDESVWSIARRLRPLAFDVGIALPNSSRSALELWLGRVRRRIGYDGRARSFMLTQSIRRPSQHVRMRKRSRREIEHLIAGGESLEPPWPTSAHHVHHYLHLVSCLGANPDPLAPHITVLPEEAQAFLAKLNFKPESKKLFGLNPGAEYGPAKRWPTDRFIAAAIELHKVTGCHWLIFGGARDQSLTAEISSAINSAVGVLRTSDHNQNVAIDLAGKTTLRELCVALKNCQLLLTNDTGPMHVAAAVGTPVIALFGSTAPELTGPAVGGAIDHRVLRAHVPCSPCFLRACPIDLRCMKSLNVNDVINAAREILMPSKRPSQ
jgi:heptosyltransferase II